MNEELRTLARAYMALPGAPIRPRRVAGWIADGDGAFDRPGTYRAASTCMLWRLCGLEWLPALNDRANGGVMLATLGAGWLAYQREADSRWEVSRPDGEHRQEGATLAEAVARVAVAVGRAG